MKHSTEQVNDEQERESEPTPDQPVQFILPDSIHLPVLHAKKFAELNGLSEGVVGGWLEKGYLPTVKMGRYTMINLVALTEQLKAAVTS